MYISKNCNLVLSNLFEYDFKSCAYSILKSIGWDLSNIDYHNKEKRNIQIGLLQRDNPNLTKFINNTIETLIDNYIDLNKLFIVDIIIRQKDGFITTKKLKIINSTMPIELRAIISKLIISSDRKMFLIINSNGKVDPKGIRDKTIDISFYNLFRNLDFISKRNLMRGLESIRLSILNSDNIHWFTRINNNSYEIPIIDEGTIRINKSTLKMIDINEIDKNFVWEEFCWPFAEGILIHYY